MSDLRRALSRAVRAERTRAQLSQEELADRLGWERHVITAIEGNTRSIGLDEAPAICAALGIHLERLFLDATDQERAALGL